MERFAVLLFVLLTSLTMSCGVVTVGCTPGATESCACAAGGSGIRTCNGAGTSFGACEGCAVCTAGTTQACSCAGGQTGAQTCNAGGTAYGACVCSTMCTAGTTRACTCTNGNAGTQTCDASGTSFGACGNCATTVCTPGQTQSCACAGGGTGTQTCNAAGSAFGTCSCGGTCTRTSGQSCATDTDCCADRGVRHRCVVMPGAGTICAATCTAPAGCASNCCQPLADRSDNVCQIAVYCQSTASCSRAPGQTCGADSDCCPDQGFPSICSGPPGGVLTCGALCAADSKCEAGGCCRARSDGILHCLPPSGC